MVVFLHVAVTLASLALATLTFFKPNSSRFLITYILIGAVLASGMYLVGSNSAHMLHACISGVIYLAVVLVITVLARMRFAKAQKELS